MHSGSSPTGLPGEPEYLLKAGTTVSGGITVPSCAINQNINLNEKNDGLGNVFQFKEAYRDGMRLNFVAKLNS